MIIKYVLPFAALLLLGFAVYHVQRTPLWKALAPPPRLPTESSATPSLAALGFVEPCSQKVAVAAPVPGVVASVLVHPGDHVKAGDCLFRLDDRTLQAEKELREARLKTATTQLQRLEAPPRQEQILASAARVRQAEAQVLAQKAALRHAEELFERKLLGELEMEKQRQTTRAAEEQLTAAKAEDALLAAGASAAERAVARAQVEEARVFVKQIQTELERYQVKAPLTATVLQVNVHASESVPGPPDKPPVILGNLSTLYVRAELVESQLGWFRSNSLATCAARGRPEPRYPLQFVRVEPLILPRRSLTGESGERSDTRVLQVIYELHGPADAFQVGQQVDVSIQVATDGAEKTGRPKD
jgi:HlyD family secretion protein